jgi:Tol biopolymer transport system component
LGLVVSCKPSYRYRDPLVFQRRELEEKTGDVRFVGKLWVMESDGSHLRQLTFGDSYDDHPAVYSDLTHVFFNEYPNNSIMQSSGGYAPSKLVKLDMYTGAREVLLVAKPTCSFDHALLQRTGSVIYAETCGEPPRLGPDDPRRKERIGIDKDLALPFDDYIHQLADQKPLVASPWRGAPPVENPCSSMGGHHMFAPDGRLFFECRAQNYRSVLAVVDPREPHATAKLFFDNGNWNHHLSISPDGQWVVWSSDAPPDVAEGPHGGAIMLAKTDGSHVEQISDAARSHPYFSGDGKAVIFDAVFTERAEMWRLDLATHKLAQLTHSSARYWSGPTPYHPPH